MLLKTYLVPAAAPSNAKGTEIINPRIEDLRLRTFTSSSPTDFIAAAEGVTPAVVSIRCFGHRTSRLEPNARITTTGSGVIIDADERCCDGRCESDVGWISVWFFRLQQHDACRRHWRGGFTLTSRTSARFKYPSTSTIFCKCCPGPKTLDQQAKSGDPDLKRQATWGMSAGNPDLAIKGPHDKL